jgi:hypothetical protein
MNGFNDHDNRIHKIAMGIMNKQRQPKQLRYFSYVHDRDGDIVLDLGDHATFIDAAIAAGKWISAHPYGVSVYTVRIVDRDRNSSTVWMAGRDYNRLMDVPECGAPDPSAPIDLYRSCSRPRDHEGYHANQGNAWPSAIDQDQQDDPRRDGESERGREISEGDEVTPQGPDVNDNDVYRDVVGTVTAVYRDAPVTVRVRFARYPHDLSAVFPIDSLLLLESANDRAAFAYIPGANR